MALTLHALFPNRDVVEFHYRGYGPSSARPSANALFSDSLAVFDHLTATYAGEPIIPVGFSIGAAVAAYLARHRPVVGLALVTPFDSLEAVARDLYWWAPVGSLIRNRMPTIEFVRGLLVPTALIIAEHDVVVPARRSAPLRKAIGKPRVRTRNRGGAQRSMRPSRLSAGGAGSAQEDRGGSGETARRKIMVSISHCNSAR
jgi:alpha-beta hydrolase superfamily lysophospholipase